jgi:hypothetical protein
MRGQSSSRRHGRGALGGTGALIGLALGAVGSLLVACSDAAAASSPPVGGANPPSEMASSIDPVPVPDPTDRAASGADTGAHTASSPLPGSPRSLISGQWVETHAAVSLSVAGLSGAGGTVTISALTASWANQGATCLQVAFGTLGFSSAAIRSAWVASGLSTTPSGASPAGFCDENVPGGGALEEGPGNPAGQSAKVLAQGLGVLDVSSMSTRPATLARQLRSGHTASTMLNEAVTQQSHPNPGFERALLLLQLPTIGATGAFRAALLHALPLIPGVVSLGRVHNALGQAGVGFAAGNGAREPTVVVDPRSGQMIEVRNVPAGSLFFSVGTSAFWNPSAQAGPGGVDLEAISLEVIRADPIGGPRVVDSVPRLAYPS